MIDYNRLMYLITCGGGRSYLEELEILSLVTTVYVAWAKKRKTKDNNFMCSCIGTSSFINEGMSKMFKEAKTTSGSRELDINFLLEVCNNVHA